MPTAQPAALVSERGGRANTRMTQLVLETYGNACHLRLKGCLRVATTKDHLVPYSHGGADVLENYRPACKPCNSKRSNKVLPGYGASVVVVIGPPAGGKSTYISEHAKPNDITVDMDLLARALMPVPLEQTHVYPEHVRHVAIKTRAAAIHAATRLRERVTVWIIHAIPSADDLHDYRRLGYQIITVDPGRAIVEARVATMRPREQLRHAQRWYQLHPTPEQAGAEGIRIREVVGFSASPAAATPDW